MATTKTIQFKNYGIKNIDWLINQFNGFPSTKENIYNLKEEIRNAFYNNPFIDFSTSGNVSCMIVDFENGTNCEIVYS